MESPETMAPGFINTEQELSKRSSHASIGTSEAGTNALRRGTEE
jgi:hypothetical protein